MTKDEAKALGQSVQILHSALTHIAAMHGAEMASKALAVEVQALTARAKARTEA